MIATFARFSNLGVSGPEVAKSLEDTEYHLQALVQGLVEEEKEDHQNRMSSGFQNQHLF